MSDEPLEVLSTAFRDENEEGPKEASRLPAAPSSQLKDNLVDKNYVDDLKQLQSRMNKLGKEIPSTMEAFSSLHKASTTGGVVSSKTKELIALGIAIAVRCDGCIAFHVNDAIKAGAIPQEIYETIGVAILMGGGPAVVYGAEAFEAVQQMKQ